MKDYAIHCKITHASGKQVWSIEAENEEQARELFQHGFAFMESETVEVHSVEIERIVEI